MEIVLVLIFYFLLGLFYEFVILHGIPVDQDNEYKIKLAKYVIIFAWPIVILLTIMYLLASDD